MRSDHQSCNLTSAVALLKVAIDPSDDSSYEPEQFLSDPGPMGSCCSIFSSRYAGLQCSICLANHTNLKILPRQHAFCRQCLRQLAQSQRGNLRPIACPQCRIEAENRSPPEHPQTAEESMSLDTVPKGEVREASKPRPRRSPPEHPQTTEESMSLDTVAKGETRQASKPRPRRSPLEHPQTTEESMSLDTVPKGEARQASKPRPRQYKFVASCVAPRIPTSYGSRSSDARYVAIAVNRAGEVAVADAHYRRVHIFRDDGQYLRHLGRSNKRAEPCALAYNKVGHLFVADEACDISVFTATGRCIRTLGENVLTKPHAISVTSNNNVVVCDQGFTVYLFSPEGETLFHFSTGGELGSEIQSAIFCDEKYFVSFDIHMIKVFDSGGIQLYSFGEYGNRPGEFYCPRGLAVEADNVLFICDSMNNRVEVTTLGGDLITSIGMRTSPQSVAVSREGCVFVTDKSNEIKVFKPDYKDVANEDATAILDSVYMQLN